MNNTKNSKITVKNVAKYANCNGMEVNIRSYYCEAYPTDKFFGESLNNITFAEMLTRMVNGENFYDIAFMDGGDSLVRERLFSYMAKTCNVAYDDIYNIWLYGPSGYPAK